MAVRRALVLSHPVLFRMEMSTEHSVDDAGRLLPATQLHHMAVVKICHTAAVKLRLTAAVKQYHTALSSKATPHGSSKTTPHGSSKAMPVKQHHMAAIVTLCSITRETVS